MKGRFLQPDDVNFLTVPQEDETGVQYVSTLTFPGLGRTDSYVGEPRGTEKEAEHSAANAAFFALEDELAIAVKLMKGRKQRRQARKAQGLQASLRLLTGSIQDVEYSYTYEEMAKSTDQRGTVHLPGGHRLGYIATLHVP